MIKMSRWIVGVGGLMVVAINLFGWAVQNNPSVCSDEATDITCYGDYIYVTGLSSATGENWRIEKRNISDGALQWSVATDPNPPTINEYAGPITCYGDYIYVGGSSYAPGENWRIEKRNKSDGALVWSVASNPTINDEYVYSITCDGTYIYAAGFEATSTTNYKWRIEKRAMSDGALVTAFDGDGVVTSDPTVNIDIAYDITYDAGYIYVTGYQRTNAVLDWDWRIEKRDATTGALVAAFDGDGVVISDPSSYDQSYGITCDGTYIYVTGLRYTATGDWRTEKRNATTGALVTAFDTDGIVESNPVALRYDACTKITNDGTYIYIMGYENTSDTDNQWRIEKRDATTGALVTAFDGDGIVQSNPTTGIDKPQKIIYDAGYIYVTGYEATTTADHKWRIEKRLATTGALVLDFDTDGIVQSDPSTKTDGSYGITCDGTDIYVAGQSYAACENWRIEKRDKTSGALQWSVASDPVADVDFPDAITCDGTYIYVAGFEEPSITDMKWRIEKRAMSDGALVTAFDGDGIVQSNPTTNNDIAYDITYDAGYIYVVGDEATTTADHQWRIEKRDATTGALVAAFDVDGVVQSNPSTGYDQGYGITCYGDYIYVTGLSSATGENWRIEKRNKLDGALIWSVASDPVAGRDEAGSDITCDGTYIYVAGDENTIATDHQWRVEKRNISDGALVTAFDVDGVVQSDPSAGSDKATDITCDVTYIYVSGYEATSATDTKWRIEKRNATTGALVTDFDGDGIVQSDPSTGYDYGYGITCDANYIYVAGSDESAGASDLQWRIEKRDIVSGGIAIELVDFSAIVVGEYIELQWRTEAEIDNYKWLVERAEVDKNNKFIRIAELSAKGSLSTYQLIDSLVTSGVTYWYKLGDVDKSGGVTWHGPVSADARRVTNLPLQLSQSVPSPFTEKVKIEYQVPGRGGSDLLPVSLKIYNESGQLIRVLVDERQLAGKHTICWDGKDSYGRLVSTGTYFYFLKADGRLTRKVIYIK